MVVESSCSSSSIQVWRYYEAEPQSEMNDVYKIQPKGTCKCPYNAENTRTRTYRLDKLHLASLVVCVAKERESIS